MVPDEKEKTLSMVKDVFYNIGDISYTFTFHPSFILRGGGERGYFYQPFRESIELAIQTAVNKKSTLEDINVDD